MYIPRKSEINYVKRSTSAKRDRARKFEKKKSTSPMENSEPRMFSVLGRCAGGGLATGKGLKYGCLGLMKESRFY
ncbi:hypothetical protein NDU88_000871 [Pleurodeles waltl]|uniref:Uncharacterized protein n=1 Tax=Pleurodeles waltl TaxID=8319 RepID=A0AAV7KQ18_PLEWA|nr:hypothetical protein NDU88_000871 [Pleurodeles waltl]